MTTDLLSFPFECPTQQSHIHQCGSSDSSLSYDSLTAADPYADYKGSSNSDVQLEVSGNSFVLNSCDFHKLGNLPWKRIHGNAYRLEEGSPEAFEGVMNYVVYDMLPKRKRMNSMEKEELTSMAKTLRLTKLVDHVNKKKTVFGSLFCSKK